MRRGQLRLVASPDGALGSITINQDARIYDGILSRGESAKHEIAPDRRAYLHVARGTVAAGNTMLSAGDGAAIENESSIEVRAEADSELLLFDLP